jgi:nucleotide-binding universal stress UspA family protein
MSDLLPMRRMSVFATSHWSGEASRDRPQSRRPSGRETALPSGARTILESPSDASGLAEGAAAFLAAQPESERVDAFGDGSANPLLLPYTDSDSGNRALEAVVDLSATFSAEVHVLHLREWECNAPGGRWFFETPQEALDVTRDAVERLRKLGVEARGLVRDAPRNHVPSGIVATADEIRACAIVLGARGQEAIAASLLGSVSRGVMRRAVCPVIVVRSPRGHVTLLRSRLEGRTAHANRPSDR